jgi:hypothetical protein
MKKALVVATVFVISTTVLPAGSAGATHFPHTRCDISGDSCVSVRRINGVRRLRLLLLFRYFPKHEVCVKGPEGDRTCHTYRTRRLFGGGWGSTIAWREHYPFEGRGVYRVVWRSHGQPVGSLKFHVG